MEALGSNVEAPGEVLISDQGRHAVMLSEAKHL